MHFLASNLRGPGIDDAQAVWAKSGPLDGPGTYLSVGALTSEFSDFPDGAATDADIRTTENGVSAVKACLNDK